MLKTNVLVSSETYHPLLCGMTCRRLSCRYFTTTKSETSGCVLYGNEIIDGEVIDKDVHVWMDSGKKYVA